MYSMCVAILSCMVVVTDTSLYNFIHIGECALGYNPWLELLGHGCYCGFGNYENATPEDGYDLCCKKHDDCYGNLQKSHCPHLFHLYLVPYKLECHPNCTPTCYVPFPFWLIPGWRECGMGLCKCDIEMMECWRYVQWQCKKGERPDKRPCSDPRAIPIKKEDPSWMGRFLSVSAFYGNKQRTQIINSLPNGTEKTENFLEEVNKRMPEGSCRNFTKRPNQSKAIENNEIVDEYCKEKPKVMSNHIGPLPK